ncbi:MAG: hypothetical protein AAFZ91_02625 [Pseudomonadota bacterium]
MRYQATLFRPNYKAMAISALVFVVAPVGLVLISRLLTSIG